ncbi:EAL domain-containing protein [Asticcacaulis sp. ZE23SCel15]|uniref:EAL domain-containing protein n=1 Tax=Asticcacaulis sp. ZE23SCel15 TaxID=3059027 RepID=UPI00265E0FA8|nr:EAL domain-containing protein [Asticcacaulis sp. ZE23SCel15]WKL58631.1 EAL domain-containing protein [Asticcacaulis sp. ZE23SCel15]
MADKTSCNGCRDGVGFELPITMAFQPIVDVAEGSVFAHEALVRGVNGEGAGQVLAQVSDQNRYAFDQACRVKAIELAAGLKFAQNGTHLSINFLPNAVYEPRACIRLTLATAMKYDFPLRNIIFEFTETEKLDTVHLLNILRSYRAMGFKTAIDDFGSGYAGLGLLSKFQPDLVKIDMDLIRDIDKDRVKRVILNNTIKILTELDIQVICEGIETHAEYTVLKDMGVKLMQGYLFGRPAVAAAPEPMWPGNHVGLKNTA